MSQNSFLSDEELEALREITEPAGRRPVVLLVDDDKDVLDEMRELIETADFDCLTANSADEALRRIVRDESSIDLLVTDLNMGVGGSGLDLIRELNSIGTFLPIIVLSGQAASRDVVDALRLNVLDFMLKPIEPDYFLSILNRSL